MRLIGWPGKNRWCAVWLLLCIACLPIAALKPDGGILWIAPLALLTFPSGLMMLFACYGLELLWDPVSKLLTAWGKWGDWISVGAVWFLVVGAGYAQWFVFLPWVGRRWDRLSRWQRAHPAVESDES